MPANKDEIKLKIEKSTWGALEKKQITALLPKLPQRVLEFLNDRLSKSDFDLVKEELYIAIFDGSEALDDLQQGKVEPFVQFLDSALEKQDYNFGEYLIPLVLEIRQLIHNNKISGDDRLNNAINNFEIKTLEDLPDAGLRDLIEKNLLEAMGKVNLLNEVQRRYSISQFTNGDQWAKDLLPLITNNTAMLGNESIIVDSKKYTPEIKNWLLDYVNALPNSVSERTTFDEVQFIRNSPNVSKLTTAGKNMLFAIIKLYAWLLKPSVNEEEETAENRATIAIPGAEIVQPKSLQRNREPQVSGTELPSVRPGLALGGSYGQQTEAPVKQPPAVPNSPEQRIKMQQQLVDQKLEELKNKVRK